MKRIVNIAKSHKEAEEYDLKQMLSITPEQRHEIAFKLKKKFYGEKCIDIRASRKVVIK